MWVLYATQEEMLLARCELIYLTNLVSFFNNSTSYSRLLGNAFLELSSFQLEFANKMQQLELQFDENKDLFVKGKDIELLETIYSGCHKSRDCFYTLHKSFLIEIDNKAKEKLLSSEVQIHSILSRAEKGTLLVKQEKQKPELELCVDSLKLNTKPLLTHLLMLRRSINQLSITHAGVDTTLAILEKSLVEIEKFYTIETTQLYELIISKLDFVFSKKQPVVPTCEKILDLCEPFEARTVVEINDSRKNDIQVVVKFISEHMSFFYAPFKKKHSSSHRFFTRWANANACEMTEVSNGLRKYLKSEHAIERFSDALFSLKEGEDKAPLKRLLMKNKGLLKFLKDCADFPYPIIAKWEARHEREHRTNEWDKFYGVYK